MRKKLYPLLISLPLLLGGCGYNTLQSTDENVKASWSEVINQYQRRSDLVPNLVKTVQGYAKHEKTVFVEVAEARSRAGSMQVSSEILNNPEAFTKFQAAQGQLTRSLGKLLAVSESYPQLKADTQFRDLQAQLEGTENRIAVARNRYIKSVQDYNLTVRSFPNNLTAMGLGYKVKPNFNVENEQEISKAPKVNFDSEPEKK